MIDLAWQLTAAASLAAAVPAGLVLRRGIDKLDEQRALAAEQERTRRATARQRRRVTASQ